MDRARRKALEVLIQWEKRGSSLDPLFSHLVMEDPNLTDLDKRLVREIVYGVLRWQARLDWVIAANSRIKPQRMQRAVIFILRIGAYQILFMDRIPPRAAVDESVKLAKGLGRKEAVPLINAVLRAIAEGRREIHYPDPITQPLEYIAACHSHPKWLVRRWVEEFDIEEATRLCVANNQIPSFTFRVNTLKAKRDEVSAALQGEGIKADPTPYSPVGLIINEPPLFERWRMFQQGWLQVQDEAAQLVSFILAPQPGQRVLDLCAAPGGKTTHLAELMQNKGEVVALDISDAKLCLVKDNCRRLGISIVKTISHDATTPFPFPPRSFDRVLVDVPCTGLGTLRRNPDIKWQVKERDIWRLAALQKEILRQAAPMVKEGGAIVYSTCTLTNEENEEVIEAFLAEQEAFAIENAAAFLPNGGNQLVDEKGFLRTFPHRHRTDGFFAARLQRR